MKTTIWHILLLTAFFAASGHAASTSPSIRSQTLANGLRLVVVHFPGSTNVSLFTFVPLGATAEGASQTQWSHLIEHLVIRSTVSGALTECNAETMSDHMRLDFYGNTGNWQRGLEHDRRWLEGVSFTEASLGAEKRRVNQECDNVARRLATHKFAIHAWSQGFRFGYTNVALEGDVSHAGLSAVQRLRDDRLAVSNRVTVCIVGGVEPSVALGEAAKELGGLSLRSTPAPAVKTTPGDLDLAWDLEARHLLLTWPIPDFRQPEHAAMLVAVLCLNQALSGESQLSRQTGMAFAGADLATPEGTFFYVSASLQPGADFSQVRQRIVACVGGLLTDAGAGSSAPLMAQALSAQLTEVPAIEMLRAQIPPGMNVAMVEGNVGLQLGMAEYRFGIYRPALASQIAKVSAVDVQRAARRFLSEEKLTTCSIKPGRAR